MPSVHDSYVLAAANGTKANSPTSTTTGHRYARISSMVREGPAHHQRRCRPSHPERQPRNYDVEIPPRVPRARLLESGCARAACPLSIGPGLGGLSQKSRLLRISMRAPVSAIILVLLREW